MWKGVISPSRNSLSLLKFVRPILQEPSTRKTTSAAASLSHSSGFLSDGPEANVTNGNQSSAVSSGGRGYVVLEAQHNQAVSFYFLVFFLSFT